MLNASLAQNTLIAFGLINASVAGTALGYWGLSVHEQKKVELAYKAQAGAQEGALESESYLKCSGIYRRVILLACQWSLPSSTAQKPPGRFWSLLTSTVAASVKKAGLAGKISQEGIALTRRNLALGSAIGAGLVGSAFSTMLAALLCLAGFIYGYQALSIALKKEIELRAASVEHELSQLIEVLVLGLRSGLSFDRSLEFYCHYFANPLSHLCSLLQTQWSHGLISREEGLRTLSESYDSPLLERIMESIIRSLRFGTSMAETLSNAGAEIRATRKSKLEEQVAKAPVKMLIPIGGLILPAMLILILGPVILELISGF